MKLQLIEEAENFIDDHKHNKKGRVRLVDSAPLKVGCKSGGKRQNSPVPLAVFAGRQYTRKRNLAVRDDEKPFPAGSSSSGEFRA
jgi:hypothetical protein